MNHELLRLALAAQGLGPAEIEDLVPPDAADAPPPLPALAELYPLQRADGTERRAGARDLRWPTTRTCASPRPQPSTSPTWRWSGPARRRPTSWAAAFQVCP
jgi:hypothetical protein